MITTEASTTRLEREHKYLHNFDSLFNPRVEEDEVEKTY